MTVHHHLDDSTLLRFASGSLDEAFAVVVSSHMAMCGTCQTNMQLAEEVGGEVLNHADMVSMSDGAFDRLFSTIEKLEYESGDEEARAPLMLSQSDVPAPLQRYIGSRMADVSWKHIAPGIKQHKIDLTTDSNGQLYLLHIAPGKAVPEHGHGGSEMTLVISGAYRDELGRFGPGDIADLDEHVEHQPRVEDGAACICLVATEAPTRFKDIVSRFLQPFIGI